MNPTTGMHSILVPLDGSSFGEQALPLAVCIARARSCRLQLVHVHRLNLWPDEVAKLETLDTIRRILHAEGETYLRDVQQRFATRDLVIDTSVVSGEMLDTGQALSQLVQEHPVDMVVLASHGRGGLKRAWLGSVADYLIRHLTVPVLVVRPGETPEAGDGKILVPLDGSALAEVALEEACMLAEAERKEIVLLRVVSPVMQTIGSLETPYVGYDAQLTSWQRAAAEDYLDDLEEGVRARGIKCVGLTMIATSVAESIIDMARPAHFGLIAMATQGRSGLRRLVLGSVTDKVIRGADVPVLVVRPTGSGARETQRPVRAPVMAGPRSCAL